MQRYSSFCAGLGRPVAARSAATSLSFASVILASTSARSRRALISAMNASFSAVAGYDVTDGCARIDGFSWFWNRAFQATPVFRYSQIPAPAMPSSRTAHMPSHGNSQRLRGIGCRYSGRSRSIRPPRHPVGILAGCRGGAPTETPHTRWRGIGLGIGRRLAGGSASGSAITMDNCCWLLISRSRIATTAQPLCSKGFRAPLAGTPRASINRRHS